MNKSLGVDMAKFLGVLIVGGYFLYCLRDLTDWHFIDGVDLIFHEAGHTIMFFAGRFIMVLSGSLFQILIPFILASYFFFRKNYYETSLIFIWLGYNLVNISVYIGDAIKQELDLLGGDATTHDWTYLLGQMGLLDQTYTISAFVNGLGFTVVFGSIIFALYYSKKTT